MNNEQLAALTEDQQAQWKQAQGQYLPSRWLRAALTALADARLELAEHEKAVASLRQSLTVMQPLYEAQKDTIAKLEAEVARLTEELREASEIVKVHQRHQRHQRHQEA